MDTTSEQGRVARLLARLLFVLGGALFATLVMWLVTSADAMAVTPRTSISIVDVPGDELLGSAVGSARSTAELTAEPGESFAPDLGHAEDTLSWLTTSAAPTLTLPPAMADLSAVAGNDESTPAGGPVRPDSAPVEVDGTVGPVPSAVVAGTEAGRWGASGVLHRREAGSGAADSTHPFDSFGSPRDDASSVTDHDRSVSAIFGGVQCLTGAAPVGSGGSGGGSTSTSGFVYGAASNEPAPRLFGRSPASGSFFVPDDSIRRPGATPD